MFCRISIFIGKDYKGDILEEIRKLLDAKKIDDSYIEKEGYLIGLLKNDEYDSLKAKDFPDGFLYFPLHLEFEIDEGVDQATIVGDLNNILCFLWENKLPGVAATDIEHPLIKSGGYNRLDVPWNRGY